MKQKFALGRIVLKQEAADMLAASGQDMEFFLAKHAIGDWGEESGPLNEQGLREGQFVKSRYKTLRGDSLGIITFLRTKETVLYRGPNFGDYYLTDTSSLPVPKMSDSITYTISEGQGPMSPEAFLESLAEDENDAPSPE